MAETTFVNIIVFEDKMYMYMYMHLHDNRFLQWLYMLSIIVHVCKLSMYVHVNVF